MKAHPARTSCMVDSAKDGKYREVASLHVPIVTERTRTAKSNILYRISLVPRPTSQLRMDYITATIRVAVM